MRIASQGYKYIIILLCCGILLSIFPSTRPVAILLFLLAGFVAYFFRDPERTVPNDPRLLVSPADGKVVYVGPDQAGGSDRIQISIFLSIFDVHINRSPLSAWIHDVRYTPGSFLPAYRAEASHRNEQNEVELTDGSWRAVVRQVAGVVARRIVFYKKKGDHLERGERFGLIQFGSRVDVLLPREVEVRVATGARVKGGETVLAARP